MLDDVRYNANINAPIGETRIDNSKQSAPSFKGDPNAVDTTPTADTYSPQAQPEQAELSMGEQFVKYGIPTGLALHAGTLLFNKANGGKYENSLVGRIGAFGDRVSNTGLVRNGFVDKMKTYGSTIKRNAQAFIDRHSTLSAMQKTPTAPECPLVTNFLETQAEADLKEAAGKITNYFEKNPKTLREAGATKEEIDAIKASGKYGKGLFGRIKNESQAVEEFLINKMGAAEGKPDMMARVEKGEAALRKLLEERKAGLSDPSLTQFEREYLKEDIARLTSKVQNYRANVLETLKYRAAGIKKGDLQSIIKEPMAHRAQLESVLNSAKDYSAKMSQYHNKVISISAPTTKLGRFLPKALKLGVRGLTFGGGFFNSLFVGFFLGETIKNTIDAPKEQKTSTFVNGLFENMSWVISMPLAVKGMHALNGLKNLGKAEAQVKAYEDAFKSFKAKAKARGFANKAEYDAAWKVVEDLKNVGTKPKGFKWLLSKFASFTSIGLGQKPAYKEVTEKFGKNWFSAKNLSKVGGNIKRALAHLPKNAIGYPLRFALYMFAFQPVVDKLFTTPIQAVLGKPFDPEKAKEEREKAQEQAQMEALRKYLLYPGPSIRPNPEAVKGLENLDVDKLPDDNMIKQELIKRGLAKPSGVTSKSGQDARTGSVNGVSITTTTDKEPFMPPQYPQGGYGYPTGGVVNNNPAEKDPNKSDYDTIPRSYMPQIDKSNPVPYSDPLADPSFVHNYDAMEENAKRSDAVMNEIQKFIDNGCKSDY